MLPYSARASLAVAAPRGIGHTKSTFFSPSLQQCALSDRFGAPKRTNGVPCREKPLGTVRFGCTVAAGEPQAGTGGRGQLPAAPRRGGAGPDGGFAGQGPWQPLPHRSWNPKPRRAVNPQVGAGGAGPYGGSARGRRRDGKTARMCGAPTGRPRARPAAPRTNPSFSPRPSRLHPQVGGDFVDAGKGVGDGAYHER